MPRAPDVAGPGLIGVHDVIVEADGKEDRLLLPALALEGALDFPLHPVAGDGVARENDEELVETPDGGIDGLADAVADGHVFRRVPAGDAGRAQVGIQPVGEGLVLAGIADETGVVASRGRWLGAGGRRLGPAIGAAGSAGRGPAGGGPVGAVGAGGAGVGDPAGGAAGGPAWSRSRICPTCP